MKIKSKSQVTMLIIAGLVIFIAVSLVLYLAKTSVKKSLQQSAKKAQTSEFRTQPIKEFVASCLDRTAKDAVLLVAKQGGYIYKSQGGTLIDFDVSDEGKFFVKDKNLRVAYNIKKPWFDIPPRYYSSLPTYPWEIFPYDPLNPSEKTFIGIFGVSSMPSINSSGGPHSIQTQIEAYIDNNINKCLDFTLFKKQGFKFEISKSSTEVTLGVEDITINSKIPIKVKNKFTKENLELKEFSSNLEVRLSDLYYFVKALVNKDIQKITFDIQDKSNNKNSFTVSRINDIYQKDDLIIVKDEKSLIDAKPLEYVFARENRYPALYYIKQTNLEFPKDYLIREEDLIGSSELKAEDPDEDVTYISIKALLPTPELPIRLQMPFVQFKISTTDGDSSDYQIITVRMKT